MTFRPLSKNLAPLEELVLILTLVHKQISHLWMSGSIHHILCQGGWVSFPPMLLYFWGPGWCWAPEDKGTVLSWFCYCSWTRTISKYASGFMEPFMRTYLPVSALYPSNFHVSNSVPGTLGLPIHRGIFEHFIWAVMHTYDFLTLPMFPIPENDNALPASFSLYTFCLCLSSPCFPRLSGAPFPGMFYSTPDFIGGFVVNFSVLILFVLQWGAVMWWGNWPKSDPIYTACGGFISPHSGQCDTWEFC